MFVDWIIDIATACDERGTRHDTTTDMSDGRCFLETHCILWERQQTTQVIASSPSDVSRDGQSMSDSRTVGTCRRDLTAALPQRRWPFVSLSHDHRRLVWIPAPLAESMLWRPGSVTVNFDRREHVVTARVRDGELWPACWMKIRLID